MAVKLRLARMGRKKRPFYRIVAIDSRKPRKGRFIEKLGYYNPLSDPIDFRIDEERALYWLKTGAIPSPTVKSLLRKQGLLLKWEMMRRGFQPAQIEEEMKKWEVLQIERKRRLELLRRTEEKAPVAVETGTPAEEIQEPQQPEAPEEEQKTEEVSDVPTEEASETESTSDDSSNG